VRGFASVKNVTFTFGLFKSPVRAHETCVLRAFLHALHFRAFATVTGDIGITNLVVLVRRRFGAPRKRTAAFSVVLVAYVIQFVHIIRILTRTFATFKAVTLLLSEFESPMRRCDLSQGATLCFTLHGSAGTACAGDV
jgi:hypothetical protein